MGIWNDATAPIDDRFKAMQTLTTDGYLFSKPDSAFHFAQIQYDFANQNGEKEHMANALNTQGISFAIKGDQTNAIEYNLKSLKIREEIEDKVGISGSLNNIGLLYYELGTARPDLVLKDLIKICHPELLVDYQTHFFVLGGF